MSLLASRLRYLWITLAVVVLDRATKAWFESQTPVGWRHELISNFVYLVHSRNPGIAFGVLSDSASVWTRIVLIGGSVAVIAVLAWLLVSLRSGSLTLAGIAFLLGGAAGNLTDRIAHGAVTDFFEVLLGSYAWPAFNVADSAITIELGDCMPAGRSGGQSHGPYRSRSGNGFLRGSARFLRLAGFQRGRFRHHHRRDSDHPRSHLQPAHGPRARPAAGALKPERRGPPLLRSWLVTSPAPRELFSLFAGTIGRWRHGFGRLCYFRSRACVLRCKQVH